MNAKVRDAFARKLCRQRERIFKTVADIESDLQFIAEAAEEKELPPTPAEIESPDLRQLSDREIETALREQVRLDKRIDTHELRIVCRHGIVYLDGALPSEAEHQILLKTLQDVAGFTEIVDRVQVKEILWEREDRSKGETPGAPLPGRRIEPPDTEDIVTSFGEGIEYIPPDEPPPEEE